jgi:FlaA1/EpsC-like NDP-sugar epimerase
LLIGDNPQATAHPRIFMAHEQHLPWEALAPELQALERDMQAQRWDALRERLQQLAGLTT